MSASFTSAPEDEISRSNLGERGLRYALVDTQNRDDFAAWLHADDRGFLQKSRPDDALDRSIAGIGYRRTIGVYDDAHPGAGGLPVATVNSWPAELTVPGSTPELPRTLRSWAISSVTVAASHRRRGVARNLLEGELRTAAALGVPMAMLTVSESTIYGRFGFAPAAFAADWKIDTRRVRWSGAAASGRVEYLSVEQYRDALPELHDRIRLAEPGEIEVWAYRWDQLIGIDDDAAARTASLRAVRFLDAEGATRGVALFRLSGGEPDFTQHRLTVERLDAETAEADLALWKFLLEHDLTVELTASLRRVEEPMRWLLGDFRAAHVDVSDHQYLRVLDVKAAYEARGYLAAGSVVFDVSDALGFAEGAWQLAVAEDAGGMRATVTRLDAIPDATPALRMTVNELSALYLGGVSAATLLASGRISELTPGAAAAADALLRVERAPWLSVWY